MAPKFQNFTRPAKGNLHRFSIKLNTGEFKILDIDEDYQPGTDAFVSDVQTGVFYAHKNGAAMFKSENHLDIWSNEYDYSYIMITTPATRVAVITCLPNGRFVVKQEHTKPDANRPLVFPDKHENAPKRTTFPYVLQLPEEASGEIIDMARNISENFNVRNGIMNVPSIFAEIL